jgi:hypothetical protein
MDVARTTPTAQVREIVLPPARQQDASPAGPQPTVVRLPKTTSGGADLEQVLTLGGQVRGVLPPRPDPAPGVDDAQVRAAYFVAEVALSPGQPFVRVQGFSPL